VDTEIRCLVKPEVVHGKAIIYAGFKIAALRLIRERGVSVAQAARDLEIHENILRRWAKDLSADPAQAFPGHGQGKPERLEIERLREENAKLRAERDILKKAVAFFAREAR
jgi:transposase